MKIKIIGWLFIIAAPIFILAGIGLLLSGKVFGVLGLCLGIYAFFLGSAVKAHKRWSWYAGIITISLVTIGNLVSLVVAFSPFLMLPFLLDVFTLYVFIVDRNIFLQSDNFIQPPPQFPQQAKIPPSPQIPSQPS